MSDNKKPALAEMGANTRSAASSINLDVSNTVGPDYLGQETVDVTGHPMDRPGVFSRMPEENPSDQRIARMDTGEELPVLLTSNMRADPCEGVQGSYTKIVEGECARCGYDRLRVSVMTLAGEYQETCNACDATQVPSSDSGYSMPRTSKDRAQRERESGEKLVELYSKTAYDLENSTGFGPYVSLVNGNNITRLRKDDVEKLFIALVKNDDVDIGDLVTNELDVVERTRFILELNEVYEFI